MRQRKEQKSLFCFVWAWGVFCVLSQFSSFSGKLGLSSTALVRKGGKDTVRWRTGGFLESVSRSLYFWHHCERAEVK